MRRVERGEPQDRLGTFTTTGTGTAVSAPGIYCSTDRTPASLITGAKISDTVEPSSFTTVISGNAKWPVTLLPLPSYFPWQTPLVEGLTPEQHQVRHPADRLHRLQHGGLGGLERGVTADRGAFVLQGDARSLPLPDGSVDLICTSPPYWSLRSYADSGEHYAGQIGSEETPAEYIAALLECTRSGCGSSSPAGRSS